MAEGIDALYCVGDCAQHYRRGFPAAEVFETRQSLTESLRAELSAGDTILIKGSRSAAMDEVVTALLRTLPKAEGH